MTYIWQTDFPYQYIIYHIQNIVINLKIKHHGDTVPLKKKDINGFKVLLITTEQGIPIDYAIDGANIDERKLLTRTIIPRHTTIIADKGFISNDLQHQLKQYDITLITPTRKNMLNTITDKFTRLITTVRKRI